MRLLFACRYRHLLSCLLSAALFFGPGCAKEEPIVIGFAGGLSGRVADLGIAGRNGAILAVEMKNKAGGIGGREVRLIVKDDEQNPETALRVDRELISEGVEAIIGHMTSAMSSAAVPLMNDSGTVMVSPTTTTTYLSGQDDNFLRVTSTTSIFATKMARYLRQVKDLNSAAIVYDLGNRAYTMSWHDDFSREFTSLGGQVLRRGSFRSGPDAPFLDIATQALDSGAGGLVIIASAMDAAMISQQIHKLEGDITIAGAEWASTEQLIEFGGAAVEGAVLSQFFDRESEAPAYVSFREKYRDRFGETPGFGSLNAFDAANVVLTALEQRRSGETLKETILRISRFDGAQGVVEIDAYGDANRETFITTVQEGRFRVLD